MSYFNDKTVLVTGATGLIGSNLVEKLMKNENIKVIANGRSYDRLYTLFSNYLDNPKFSIFTHDISIPFDLKEFKIDIVYHAASPQENTIIKNSPLDVILPNIYGTINCLNFLQKQEDNTGLRGRLILFSSVTIYANNSEKNITVKECDTSITDKIENSNAAYSQSKRMSEVIANAYSKQYGLDIVIARLSTVYGESKLKTETAFFEFINKAVRGENITINNPLVPKRDNIYIDDVIEALFLLAKKGVSSDVYNISSNNELGNFASIYEIAEQIINITNEFRIKKELSEIKLNSPSVDFYKRSPGLILDNSKIKLLGWNLKTSLQCGLKETIKKNLIEVNN